MPKTAQNLVDEAMALVKTLSLDETRAAMQAGAQLVDLRDVREREREGAIEGAYHAPRGMLEFWVDPTCEYHKKVFADATKPYVLYCAAGWRSALAAKVMMEMGFANAMHIDGGYAAWKGAGLPTVTVAPKKT